MGILPVDPPAAAGRMPACPIAQMAMLQALAILDFEFSILD